MRQTRTPLIIALSILILACASAPDRPDLEIPQWPQDDPRYIWETSLRTSANVEAEGNAFQQMVTGAQARNVGFGKPFGVAASGGRIYVSDTALRRIHAFDLVRKRYFQFGYRFQGTVSKPLGMAIDGSGRVYVADGTRKLVLVYDTFGLYQKTIGDPETLVRPTSVAVDSAGERIYVVDTGGVGSDQHRVIAYDGEGRELFQLGPRGGGPGQFNLPVDASVGPDGTLYVLDAGNFRVQAFDREGRFLRTWGEVGRGLGQFARPRGLAVDENSHVYVVDSFFGNVQIFNREGELLLPIGAVGKVDQPGRYALASDVDVDETGRIYVLDQLFLKLDVIKPLTGPP